MTKYLISFPGNAFTATGDDLAAAGVESRAVIEDAKAAGVYVFAGGIHEGVAPVRVDGGGAVADGAHPGSDLTGGFTVLECATRDEAILWAARIAKACRCSQELREFMYDPAS